MGDIKGYRRSPLLLFSDSYPGLTQNTPRWAARYRLTNGIQYGIYELQIFNLIHLIVSTIKWEPIVRDYQRRVFSLLTAAIFLLAWYQWGEPAGDEKQACFHDITLDLSINTGTEASELFPEIGLPPGHYRIASPEPGLLLGNAFRNLSPLDLNCKNCKNRAPPSYLPTYFQTI